MQTDDKRSDARQRLDLRVEVLPLDGRHAPFWSRARDFSMQGIFVNSTRLPEIDALLVLKVYPQTAAPPSSSRRRWCTAWPGAASAAASSTWGPSPPPASAASRRRFSSIQPFYPTTRKKLQATAYQRRRSLAQSLPRQTEPTKRGRSDGAVLQS